MHAVDSPQNQTTPSASGMGTFLISLACGVALLYIGRLLFITLLISVMFSFILEPPVKLIMRARVPRGFASFIVCSLALIVLYLVGLGAYFQVSVLVDELPNYSKRVTEISDKAVAELESMERSVYDVLLPKRAGKDQPPVASKTRRRSADPPLPPPIQEVRIKDDRSPLVTYIYSNLGDFYNFLLMASFVPFLVYFMLSWRDHMHRNFLRAFSAEKREVVRGALEAIAEMARAYVVGNFLLGILLSAISCAFFSYCKLPYWPLVGPLSGFLSLVPYVGMPLALIPPFLAAIMVYSTLTPYIAIGAAIAFLHLLALNLLYPKLVGSRVHLNPLVVTVALMVWGTLWGAMGLVLAIPITAGFKAICDNVPRLASTGKLLGD